MLLPRRPADLLLLETGLGGRLDATNVIERPLATAITPISIDHVGFLGESLSAIAAEKAGILKRGVPCIVGRQEREAFDVIEARAEALGAPLHVAGRDFDMYEQQGRLVFQTEARLLDLPLPRLNGRHQIDNAGNAIAAASLVFGDKLKEESLAFGVTHAEWPARLERLVEGGSTPMSAMAQRFGSTAATTKPAVACWRRPLPSLTSAYRVRCI